MTQTNTPQANKSQSLKLLKCVRVYETRGLVKALI